MVLSNIFLMMHGGSLSQQSTLLRSWSMLYSLNSKAKHFSLLNRRRSSSSSQMTSLFSLGLTDRSTKMRLNDVLLAPIQRKGDGQYHMKMSSTSSMIKDCLFDESTHVSVSFDRCRWQNHLRSWNVRGRHGGRYCKGRKEKGRFGRDRTGNGSAGTVWQRWMNKFKV